MAETQNTTGIEVTTPDGTNIKVGEGVVTKLAKPLRDVYGFVEDYITDKRAFLKFERQNRYRVRAIQVLQKTQGQLEAMGVNSPIAPSDKLLALIGPAISVEEDTSLQEMWAKLLAKSMNPDTTNDQCGLALILKEMPAEAAQTFYTLANSDFHREIEGKKIPKKIDWLIPFSKTTLSSLLKNGNIENQGGLDHLVRLGVFEPITSPAQVESKMYSNLGNETNLAHAVNQIAADLQSVNQLVTTPRYQLTQIGMQLMQLVKNTSN